MPFIQPDRRKPVLDRTVTEMKPGDYCFLEYRPMILAWKASPCWTTADEIYNQYLKRRASLQPYKWARLDLAWQVFFALHVLPYEVKKRKEHGEVE